MTAMLLDTQVNSKDIKTLAKNIKDIKQEDSGDFFEQIIAGLLEQVEDDKTKNFLLEKLLNFSAKEKNSNDMTELFTKLDDKKIDIKLEQNGEVLVEELLKLSFMIKNDIDIKDFKTDSKELKVALEDKTVINDFKNANNIKDLLDIAKKNDIDVKNFEFFKEEVALTPKDKQIVKDIKSEDVFKMIEKKLENSTHKLIETIKNDTTHKENTLKNILSSISTKQDSHDSKEIIQTKKEVFISSKSVIHDNPVEKDVVKEEVKNIKNEKQVVLVEDTKVKSENNIKQKDVKVQQTVSQDKNIVEKLLKKVVTKSKDSEKKDIKNIKTFTEDKVAPKNIQETLSQNMSKTVQKKVENISLSQVQVKQTEKSEVISQEVEFEKPQEIVKNEHTTSFHKIESPKHKNTQEVKHTLNSFAQDFKEQVESYKPPLMKVKMQLNPKGLGDVDVTMVNRGNNLHITVNSNPNTIAIFSQNQTEFKNSLVSMGFSELNMSFNENGKNQSDNQRQKNKNNFNQTQEEESNHDSFEITTPIYI
jgi:hypothetical protein